MRTRSNTHKLEHRKFGLDIGKIKFTIRVVAQMVCDVSILGDTQNVTGPGPEQPALTGPTLRRRLDYTISRGSFHPTQFYGYLHGVYEQKRKSW